MKDLFHDEINNCNHWIAMKIGEGCSWEEIGNLCVPAEQAEEKLGELKQALGIIPEDFCLRDWKEYVDMRKKVSSANTLVAIFDQSAENRERIKTWLINHSMRRVTDLERLWFSEPDAIDKLERYAAAFNIAFISLDDSQGRALGQRLSQLNPDCIICYCRQQPCDLAHLLHSRPYEFFTWSQGESVFLDKLDDMIGRTVFSVNTFSYETKRALHCYPVRNILYFQSDLKYVHIKTALGNDALLYAKLSDMERSLQAEGLWPLFLRCHKSFLVNRVHIRTVNKPDHTLELSTGEAVPISDACYKSVLQTLTR